MKTTGALLNWVIVGSFLFLVPCSGQADPETSSVLVANLIEQALDEYQKANYTAAIGHLEEALALLPNHAETHYYLGHFLHYLCYDSTPLTGYGRDKSDQVLEYLRRAVELDPGMGDAYYFIGAEYGVRALDAAQHNNVTDALSEFRAGMAAGGYPPWLIEYGRNILRSCQQDAILIVQGDAETNPIEYLQGVDGFRTDVSVIPFALLTRPWFVALLKTGLAGFIKPVPISWSDDQIFSMHPYKWQSNIVRIPVPDSTGQLASNDELALEWLVNPNLGHGEELRYLSTDRAALIDIVRTNGWQRPIHFSLGCPQAVWEGLEPYMQSRGLILRVLPQKPEDEIDIETTRELLLSEDNFTSLPTLAQTDMPRISHLLQNYRTAFLRLIYLHLQRSQKDDARTLMNAMKTFLPEDILPIRDDFRNRIEAFERMIEEG